MTKEESQSHEAFSGFSNNRTGRGGKGGKKGLEHTGEPKWILGFLLINFFSSTHKRETDRPIRTFRQSCRTCKDEQEEQAAHTRPGVLFCLLDFSLENGLGGGVCGFHLFFPLAVRARPNGFAGLRLPLWSRRGRPQGDKVVFWDTAHSHRKGADVPLHQI